MAQRKWTHFGKAQIRPNPDFRHIWIRSLFWKKINKKSGINKIIEKQFDFYLMSVRQGCTKVWNKKVWKKKVVWVWYSYFILQFLFNFLKISYSSFILLGLDSKTCSPVCVRLLSKWRIQAFRQVVCLFEMSERIRPNPEFGYIRVRSLAPLKEKKVE